ncbi:MAG: hypothetical protein WCF95_07025 [bacterium]
MGIDGELKFSKRKQLNRRETIDTAERDRRFKLCVIYLTWLADSMSAGQLKSIIAAYEGKDLHHIRGKGTRELRYCLGNAALSTREKHSAAHAVNDKADPRSPARQAFFKTIDFTET